ncbi:MAG: 3'-5' exonuclease, partial [Venatoribacter sp.]
MQPAFLLSHSWRDDAQGTELSFWWHTPEGTVLQKVRQASVCFIAQAQQQQAQQIADLLKWPVTIKPVPLRFFNQQPAAACYLPEGFKARWRELLQEQGIALKEADIRAPERYLMERFVYGKAWLQQPWQQQQGYWLALDKSIKPLAIKWQPQLKALALDIETSSLHTDQSSQLYAISFYADDLQLVLMQGKGENTSTLRFYADEPSLLKALLQVLQEYDPDAILGWNLVQFDFSFLLAKFRQYQIPFALGRDGSELKLRPSYNNPEQVQAVLAGRVILDGISQLKNATYQLDSFALNDVAEYFLQDHKLLQSDDLGQDIEQLFHSDKAQLAAYNLKDSELVWRIFQQADLLNFAIERSSLTGLLMGRVGGSVAAFENLYLPRLHRAGYVAPNSEDG